MVSETYVKETLFYLYNKNIINLDTICSLPDRILGFVQHLVLFVQQEYYQLGYNL